MGRELCEYRFVTAHSQPCQVTLSIHLGWQAKMAYTSVYIQDVSRTAVIAAVCTKHYCHAGPRNKTVRAEVCEDVCMQTSSHWSLWRRLHANFFGSLGNQPLCGERPVIHSIRLKLCCVAVSESSSSFAETNCHLHSVLGWNSRKQTDKTRKECNAQVCWQTTSDF